jgi:DNA-binding transcriptional LysR family regulator
MLDFYKLQIFTTVAQEGSFSAAAERLYITQSAVSQHVKALELRLGRTLFQRGQRGVKLTSHGEILLRYAQQIFALLDEAENALIDVEKLTEGRLSIGATPGISIYLVPDWVQRFRAEYPQLSVSLKTGVTAQVVADVLEQKVELGFIEGELEDLKPSRLNVVALEEVEQMVVVGFKHPWWDREAVQIEDLHGQSSIVRPPESQSRIWLDDAMRQHGIELMIGAEFDNLESIKWAVVAGRCLTVLPKYVVQNEVEQGLIHLVPIVGQPLKRVLKLISVRGVTFSALERAFLKVLSLDYSALAQLLERVMLKLTNPMRCMCYKRDIRQYAPWRAINSVSFPRSTNRPACITAISSIRSTSTRRCVSRIRVRPLGCARMLSRSARSLSVSRLGVGSSSTRIGAFLSRTRASATRCRSPALSLTPFSPARVV